MNDRLQGIIADVLNVDKEEVTLETGADTCGAWDSLAQVGIISRVIDEFGVDIPFDKMMDMNKAEAFQSFIEGE